MKKILLSMLLVFVFTVSGFSQMRDMPMMGQGGGHGKMTGMGDMDMMGDSMMCMEHMRHMGLSDDQMAKMKPLHREMQKKHIRFKADEKLAQIELEEIMEIKNFDLDKASAAMNKIGDMKTAHHLEMLKAMKEVRSILTDEQFKKMCKMAPMKMGAKKQLRKRIHKPVPKNLSPKQPVAEVKPKAQADDTVHKH